MNTKLAVVFALALTANLASAVSSNCLLGLYTGVSIGQLDDQTNYKDSDCYNQALISGQYTQNIYDAVTVTSTSTFTTITVVLTNSVSLLIQQSDTKKACTHDNKITQVKNRLSTPSGFLQMLTTGLWAYYIQPYQKANKQFKTSFNELIMGKSSTCEAWGFNFAIVSSFLLNTKTPSFINLNTIKSYSSGSTEASNFQ